MDDPPYLSDRERMRARITQLQAERARAIAGQIRELRGRIQQTCADTRATYARLREDRTRDRRPRLAGSLPQNHRPSYPSPLRLPRRP